MIWTYLRTIRRIIAGLIGELSDEGPYARHLAAGGLVHSPDEWRRFSDARLRARFTRPKCC
jgi:hypothetical protein